MIKRIMWAAFCSLALCMSVCGCNSETEELILIGETKSEAVISQVEEDSALAVEMVSSVSDLQGTEAEICVYVCGAVVYPGVVRLKEGSRAADALEAAGGFGEDAATDYVNLAARVSDGEKLYFPRMEECQNRPLQWENAESAGEDGDNRLININTADTEALCTLPGIGESRAADIIRYRENMGPFENCEEIMQVSGIKTSLYNKIRDLITVK